MPEISDHGLRDMHANLSAAGIPEYTSIDSDTARLGARIDFARDAILDLKAERDTIRGWGDAAHDALNEAGAPARDGVLSSRIAALAASLDTAKKERDTLRAALEEANTTNARLDRYLAMSQAGRAETFAALEKANETSSLRGKEVNEAEAERDIARAEVEALRARPAERPAPPDLRDPPVKTSEEEAAERLWGALFTLGGGLNRADFDDGIEGIADAVEEALGYNLAQLRKLTTERDRMESIAMEQFRRRLSGT